MLFPLRVSKQSNQFHFDLQELRKSKVKVYMALQVAKTKPEILGRRVALPDLRLLFVVVPPNFFLRLHSHCSK